MNDTQLKKKEIREGIIGRIIKDTINFQNIVKKNWEKVDNDTLNKAIKEYLTFVMYCAVYLLQNNEFSELELEEFHKDFYELVVKAGLLNKTELLDYEKLSRTRYMDFYQTLFGGDEKQLSGKRLNALVAKETLYIQKLLSDFDEKGNATGELYTELFSVYSGLMLQIQLMF